jgi:hypothetical protein
MSSAVSHGQNRFTIAVSDSDGTDKSNVYIAGGSEQLRYPTWSPTGGSISFVSGPAPVATWYNNTTNYGAYSIKAVDVSVSNGTAVGSNARTICSYTSSDQIVVVEQRWSPTSTVDKIAFIAVTPAGWGIYTVSASAGSTPTRIYLAPSNSKINPGPLEGNALGWSNDGSQIAFVERDSATNGTITYAIKIINSDGSGTPTTLQEVNNVLGGVQWSHPGQNNQNKLVYYRVTPNAGTTSDIDLYTIGTSSGSTPTALVTSAANQFWSPDNTSVIYQDYTNSSTPVMKKIDVASGTITTLSIATASYYANYGDWKQP